MREITPCQTLINNHKNEHGVIYRVSEHNKQIEAPQHFLESEC